MLALNIQLLLPEHINYLRDNQLNQCMSIIVKEARIICYNQQNVHRSNAHRQNTTPELRDQNFLLLRDEYRWRPTG